MEDKSEINLSARESQARLESSLKISRPENFVLDKERFEEELRKLSDSRPMSLERLRKRGIVFKGVVDSGPINVDKIVGNDLDVGWSGLVEGMGEPTSTRTPSVETVMDSVKKFFSMSKKERGRFIKDIELVRYTDGDGKSEYYVGGNGTHRVMALKALSNMGCRIVFSGMRVQHFTSKE